MRLLILDDSPEERNAFKEFFITYYPDFNIDFTDNLLDFHELLFESGMRYDRIIIDASLEMPPDMDKNMYDAFLCEVGLTGGNDNAPLFPGWEYFNRYMRSRSDDIDINKVLIKTGYAKSIQRTAKPEELENVHILNKGDPDYNKKLKKFLVG